MSSRRMVTWNVTVGLRRGDTEHRELWLELCSALERITQSPTYADILASGDGVPDADELP